jgi:hypothetical protein
MYPWKKTPSAKRCINYYQEKSTVRGREIEGCENNNMEDSCWKAGVAHCHIEVEWDGAKLGKEEALKMINAE